jgi:hypothetical protein
MDRALMSVTLPAGSHLLRFYYIQDYFVGGAVCSVALACLALFLIAMRGDSMRKTRGTATVLA